MSGIAMRAMEGTSILTRKAPWGEILWREYGPSQNRIIKILSTILSCWLAMKIRPVNCVEEDSSFAAKDWSGEKCIKAADHECPSGKCERASNCYWNSVYEGQNRTTRFEEDAYGHAATQLYGTNESYVREIAEFGVAGVVVSVLLLIFWIIFLPN